jgi:hypothetical protein
MKQVRLQKEAKYAMVTPVIPPGVTVEGDMLGEIESLRYSDHDLSDAKKFPELAPQNYLHTIMRPRSLVMTLEPKEWETRLQRVGILNLLEIPHFGRSMHKSMHVLSCFLVVSMEDSYGWTELCR